MRLGVGDVETSKIERDQAEDQQTLLGGGSKVEERKQRNRQQPGQKRRAEAAVMIAPPQNRKDEILHREHGEGVVQAGPLQGEGEAQEQRYRGRKHPKRVIGSRIEQVKIHGYGVTQ